MRILVEDKFEKYSCDLFYAALLEYLNKSDVIKGMPAYVSDLIEPYVDTDEKRKEYVQNPKVQEIKQDIDSFIRDWFSEVKKLDRVKAVRTQMSPYFGMSSYIYVTFSKPLSHRLEQYYSDNIKRYDQVKFRFTDHSEFGDRAKHPAKGYVEMKNKTFLQAADEMLDNIKVYMDELKQDEQVEIKKIKNKERRNKQRSKSRLKSNSVEESFKLQISESVSLDERLEDIGNSTYCTDSAQDIANWIVNKPKPYRIIYDKTYDVWCIADAAVQTHKDMSIDMFDSNYLYGIAKDLDSDIELMRKEDNLNDGWTDAEVYSDYQFDHYNIKGLIFIPENMEYRDYEESGFYSAKTELVNGTIFTTRHSEFSDSGIFKSLYLKLKIMGAIKPEIEAIWKKALLLKFDSDKMLNWFYDVAGKHGYSDTEISRFIDDHLTDYLK